MVEESLATGGSQVSLSSSSSCPSSPLRTCNCVILWTVLRVLLLHSLVPCWGHHHHWAGQAPGTFKAVEEGSHQPGTQES